MSLAEFFTFQHCVWISLGMACYPPDAAGNGPKDRFERLQATWGGEIREAIEAPAERSAVDEFDWLRMAFDKEGRYGE